MRIFVLVATFIVASSPAFAQLRATHHASLKQSVARRPASTAQTVLVSARESAFRKLGVIPFTMKGFSSDQGERLLKQFANDMTAMSYVQAVPVAGSPALSERAHLSQALMAAQLDGAIVAEVAPDRIVGQILSRSGRNLVEFSLARHSSLLDEAQVKDTSRAIVDLIASIIPYRGYITRELPGGLYEINLGKNQGVLAGQRFRVFDFATASLRAEKVDKGEIKVVEAGAFTSIVEPTGSEVKPFLKIGYSEQARGMSTPEQVETRGYARVGAGIINISGTGDPRYTDRAYNVSSTPAFTLGGHWKKLDLDLLLAQARGDDTDLVFNELIADYQILDLPFGGLNRFRIGAGGRFARVSITTSKNTISPLQSTTSLSPEFSARLDRILKGPVKGFVAASAYFPIFVSGMDASALLFSYGIGGDAGLSLDISQRIFMEVGGRYHLIRRPVEGQTAVNETYTEIFGQLGYRF